MASVIASAAGSASYPTWLVCLLGIGIVFLGLICLILLCYVMSGIIRIGASKAESNPVSTAPVVTAAPAASVMSAEEKGRVIAAVSCAIAEELGTSPEAIRINSIKRM